jgi:hypothetical protein
MIIGRHRLYDPWVLSQHSSRSFFVAATADELKALQG